MKIRNLFGLILILSFLITCSEKKKQYVPLAGLVQDSAPVASNSTGASGTSNNVATGGEVTLVAGGSTSDINQNTTSGSSSSVPVVSVTGDVGTNSSSTTVVTTSGTGNSGTSSPANPSTASNSSESSNTAASTTPTTTTGSSESTTNSDNSSSNSVSPDSTESSTSSTTVNTSSTSSQDSAPVPNPSGSNATTSTPDNSTVSNPTTENNSNTTGTTNTTASMNSLAAVQPSVTVVMGSTSTSSINLSGTVTDSKGNTIGGATVLIYGVYENGQNSSVYGGASNANGSFNTQFTFPSGIKNLSLSLSISGKDSLPVTIPILIAAECKEDNNRGHGNDADGIDEDNTGNSTGVNANAMDNRKSNDKKNTCKSETKYLSKIGNISIPVEASQLAFLKEQSNLMAYILRVK